MTPFVRVFYKGFLGKCTLPVQAAFLYKGNFALCLIELPTVQASVATEGDSSCWFSTKK